VVCARGREIVSARSPGLVVVGRDRAVPLALAVATRSDAAAPDRQARHVAGLALHLLVSRTYFGYGHPWPWLPRAAPRSQREPQSREPSCRHAKPLCPVKVESQFPSPGSSPDRALDMTYLSGLARPLSGSCQFERHCCIKAKDVITMHQVGKQAPPVPRRTITNRTSEGLLDGSCVSR
jgi:hypothetical protein